MAHARRVLQPGAVYHVYTRGALRERIFRDDRDRQRFLRYLALAAVRFAIEIRSFCLMDNHVHIHLCTPLPNLSTAMQMLFSSYARYFNRRHTGSGHVFESRFHSPIVEPGGFEVRLSRYIHRNPVKAGMVAKPEDYPWSSYGMYVDPRRAPKWLNASVVLVQLGDTPKSRVWNYRRLVGDGEEEQRDATTAFERTVAVGSEHFRSRFETRQEGEAPREKPPEAPLAIDSVLKAVAREFQADEWTFAGKRKESSGARIAAALALRSIGLWTRREIGDALGGVTERTVARYEKEARRRCRGGGGFRSRLDRSLADFGARL